MAHPRKSRDYVEFSHAVLARLAHVLDVLDVKKVQLEKPLGIGQSSISQWFLRGNLPIGYYFARLPLALYEVTGTWINLHWLATGMGDMYLRAEEQESQNAAYARGGLTVLARVEEALADERRRILAVDQRVTSTPAAVRRGELEAVADSLDRLRPKGSPRHRPGKPRRRAQ